MDASGKIFLKQLLERLPSYIFWKDKNGVYLGCNSALAKSVGLSASEELIGKTDYDLPWTRAESDAYRADDQAVMELNKPRINFEEKQTTKEGKELTLLTSKVPLTDENGLVVGVLGIYNDITELKKVQSDLLDAKEKAEAAKGMVFLKQLLERLPSYVFWKDRNGVFLGGNSAFAKSVGLAASEELIGKTDYDLPWTKAESDVYRADDREVMELNKPRINFEEKQTTKEGREITLLTSKVPLTDENGAVMGVLGIYNDITELKKVQSDLLHAKEKAEAANEAKTQFIQNMQHDIRTPAAGLFGLLNQLEETKTDPEEKALFGMLAQASENLLNLCNDVVSFGDVENREPIAETMVDIRKITQNVLNLNKPAAFGKNLVLKLTVDRAVPANVFLDEFRLQRVLINLLGNAIKFTEKGHIALHITSRIDDQRHGVVRIDVSDTGIGIPSDKKRVIFERFTRLTPSNTNRYPGTGLGLYVVKQFVEDLQGDFSLDSTPGKGSCFTVMLPFKIPLLETAKQPETIEEEYHSPLVICHRFLNR